MILANIVRDITKNMENSEYTISICMILLIAIIIYLIWSIGHKKGKEEIEITSIDKIPYEVLVVGFTIVIVVFAEILFSIFSSLNDIPINLVIGGLVGTYLVIYISLLVIVVSTIRRIKGKIFFRSFLIYKIGKYIKNLLKKIQQNFLDKTGAIKKLTILYVLFIIIFIVIQQIEGNLIYPFVVGSSIGLSGLWVLFAITVGGNAFGVLGMLIGVPLFGVLYTLISISTNKKLEKKNINIEEIEKEIEKEVQDEIEESEEENPKNKNSQKNNDTNKDNKK